MSSKKVFHIDTVRLLEIIPGAVTWLVLTSPIWLARPLPLAVAFFITFLTVFWVYRAATHILGLIIGYRRYKREVATDWRQKLSQIDMETVPEKETLPSSVFGIGHLLVVPLVNEDEPVLRGLIEGVAQQSYPLDRIFLIFSIEEKFHQQVQETIVNILKEYPGLTHVHMVIHPADLPGEVVGAASNRTWGAKKGVEIITQHDENVKHFIVTTMDGDAVLHPQYLSRLAYEFVIQKNRRGLFYQPAVYLMDNNIWQVPTLMRIQANSVTLATLAGWVTEPFFKETFSCFSLALTTLVESDFWDTSISIDDTPLFWRVFDHRRGDFRGVPIFTPVSSDAVQGKNMVDSHVRQYKQLLRWGWGIIVFPKAMNAIRRATEISFGEKFLWVYRYFERFAVWYTIIVLISFGFPLLVIVNPEFQTTTFAYLLPRITSGFLSAALLLLLPGAWFRKKISAPYPREWPWWRKVLVTLEGGLVVIHLFTYVFLPHLHAETRFMLGKRLEGFSFTPKFRRKR